MATYDAASKEAMMPRTLSLRSLHAALVGGVLAVALAGPARADAPAGHFTDNKNGTVTANKTGLVWQRDIAPQPMTWIFAVDYCRNLPLAGGGWRLPSVKELLTLVDRRLKNPSIDPVFFPKAPAETFWTSSSLNADPTQALWVVNFSLGLSGFIDRGDVYVRCVR